MHKIKAFLSRAGVAVGGFLVAVQVHAASVLDTAAKTAISTGFTDMKDTALDVVNTSWPYLLGITAVMFGPRIVKRLSRSL